MKKILLLLTIFALTQGLVAKKRFEISVNLNILSSESRAVTYKTTPNEDEDKDPELDKMSVTGDWYPEIKLRANLFGNLYGWGSLGFSYTKIQFSNIESKSMSVFKTGIAGGLGLTVFGYKDVDNLAISIEAGYALFKLSGDNDVNDISLSKSGFMGQVVFTYITSEKLFFEANVGFTKAYDNYEEARLKLGGFKIGLGGGLRF